MGDLTLDRFRLDIGGVHFSPVRFRLKTDIFHSFQEFSPETIFRLFSYYHSVFGFYSPVAGLAFHNQTVHFLVHARTGNFQSMS
jgi:hypothetical protein